MHRGVEVFVTVLGCCMASHAGGEVYKCVDTGGRTTYQSTPCGPAAKESNLGPLNQGEEAAAQNAKTLEMAKGLVGGTTMTPDFLQSLMAVRVGMKDRALHLRDQRLTFWGKSRTATTAYGTVERRTFKNGTTLVITNGIVTAIEQ